MLRNEQKSSVAVQNVFSTQVSCPPQELFYYFFSGRVLALMSMKRDTEEELWYQRKKSFHQPKMTCKTNSHAATRTESAKQYTVLLKATGDFQPSIVHDASWPAGRRFHEMAWPNTNLLVWRFFFPETSTHNSTGESQLHLRCIHGPKGSWANPLPPCTQAALRPHFLGSPTGVLFHAQTASENHVSGVFQAGTPFDNCTLVRRAFVPGCCSWLFHLSNIKHALEEDSLLLTCTKIKMNQFACICSAEKNSCSLSPPYTCTDPGKPKTWKRQL